MYLHPLRLLVVSWGLDKFLGASTVYHMRGIVGETWDGCSCHSHRRLNKPLTFFKRKEEYETQLVKVKLERVFLRQPYITRSGTNGNLKQPRGHTEDESKQMFTSISFNKVSIEKMWHQSHRVD